MNIEEIWLPVVGYDGYEVSNLGNINSIDRSTTDVNGITRPYKSQSIKPYISKGYLLVVLYINGTGKTNKVHRLVAEAFIPNPNNKPEVNHKDGIKTNCTVFNLEWSTHVENVQHAYDTGLHKEKYTGKPVIQLDKEGNIINRFINAREAAQKTGLIDMISRTTISACCHGRVKSAGGYVWKFDN